MSCSSEHTTAQVCPTGDFFRTKPGVKSTQVRSVKKSQITQTCSKSRLLQAWMGLTLMLLVANLVRTK